jgi:hypothetical protein
MKRCFFLSVVFLSLVCQAMPSGAATLSLDNGGNNFGPGSVLNLSAGVANSGNSFAADGYLAIALPNGALLFFQPSGSSIVPSVATSDPATLKKLFANVLLPGIINTGLISLFRYPFSGSEPAGTYTSIVALTTPGTLNIIDIKSVPFFVSPFPIAAALGTYTGTWTNQTFGSTGPVTFQVSDTSPGDLTMTITLGGNVFGRAAPPPFTLTGTLNTQGIITLHGTPAGFGTVNGTIGTNGQFNGTVSGIPAGIITSVTFSGTVSGGVFNVGYTVNFSSGPPATGNMIATHQ